MIAVEDDNYITLSLTTTTGHNQQIRFHSYECLDFILELKERIESLFRVKTTYNDEDATLAVILTEGQVQGVLRVIHTYARNPQ
jgi:hypothetical protein